MCLMCLLWLIFFVKFYPTTRAYKPLFVEVEQLHFEGERRARGNYRGLASISVCHSGWTHDLCFLAFVHLLQRFGPAGNDTF